jgi:hypothetical protein
MTRPVICPVTGGSTTTQRDVVEPACLLWKIPPLRNGGTAWISRLC